jgi:hypothetical protein
LVIFEVAVENIYGINVSSLLIDEVIAKTKATENIKLLLNVIAFSNNCSGI